MLLSECVHDVLCLIFEFLSGAEFQELYATCRPLYASMTSRGIGNRWHHTLDRRRWTGKLAYKLPKLQEVSLTISQALFRQPEATPLNNLLSFRSPLQTLKITGPGALSAFLLPGGPNHLHSPKKPSSNFDTWINLRDMLPQLRSLTITDYSELWQHVHIPDTFPVSLTFLSIYCGIGSTYTLDCPQLDYLTNLTYIMLMPINKESGNLERQLPNLTNLKSFCVHLPPADYVLPNSVTALRTNKLPTVPQEVTSTLSELSLYSHLPVPILDLPPRLTTLHLTVEDPVALAKVLTPTVTNLTVLNYSKKCHLWTLSYFPDTVLHFSPGFSCDWPTFEDFQTKMQELEMTEGIKRWLPSRLLSLSLSLFLPMESPWWPLLPKTLTYMGCHLLLEAEDDLPERWNLRSYLPNLSTSMHLRPLQSYESRVRAAPRVQEAPVWRRKWIFPQGIHTLTIILPSESHSMLHQREEPLLGMPTEHWPQTLTDLNLHWTTLSALPSFRLLPTTLTRLNIVDQDRSVLNPGRATPEILWSLANLPTQLTSLCIDTRVRFDDPEAFLKNLPVNLKILHCRSLMNLNDETIAFLPPNLEVLDMRHAQNVSEIGIMRMPAPIQTLILKLNRDITVQALRLCSRNLHTLILPKNPNFKKSMKKEILQILKERDMVMDIQAKSFRLLEKF